MTITSAHTAAQSTLDLVTDVLVIGGGLAGTWAAVSAAREGARVLKTALGYLSGNYLIAARHAALEDPLRAQAFQDYLPRQARTLEWINNNPEPWAPKTAQLLGVHKAMFLDIYNSRSHPLRIIEVNNLAIASHQEVADLFVDAGVLCERFDVNPLWDKNFRLLPS
ncbi:FAD-dependent oxidoreductase [Pseudomonas putida]|uniref:FAD-dependent oxidoreductase n=1 Tax=Pseudomonas putida TaxID=303 RepID=UPI002363434B|nr:FAD-dependent oxidoreductase [Pseudomonas putida]MDD2103635.1 FAD-dependent oxidoreductase [Pseudomonas putida]